MNRPTFQRCSLREIPSAAEGGGFEPPVREPVRQFSKLLVSATHPSFHQDLGVRNLGVISLIAGAKVMLLFHSCKFFRDFFLFFCLFCCRRSGIRDSNPRPSAWEANALPTEPYRQPQRTLFFLATAMTVQVECRERALC